MCFLSFRKSLSQDDFRKFLQAESHTATVPVTGGASSSKHACSGNQAERYSKRLRPSSSVTSGKTTSDILDTNRSDIGGGAVSETLKHVVKGLAEPTHGLDYSLLQKEREKSQAFNYHLTSETDILLPSKISAAASLKSTGSTRENRTVIAEAVSKEGQALRLHLQGYLDKKLPSSSSLASTSSATATLSLSESIRNHEVATRLSRLSYTFDFSEKSLPYSTMPLAKLKAPSSTTPSMTATMVSRILLEVSFKDFLSRWTHLLAKNRENL